MFNIVQNLTKYNYSNANRDNFDIEYIVIHYFGSLGTAKAVSDYFASSYRGASTHFALDEGEDIYQCVLCEDIAWHCGTSETYYHKECRNSNSIGVEVRPYKISTTTMYANDRDWYFTQKIVDRLVEFTEYLMQKYGIDPDHVVRHYDVTHKQCPRPWQGDDVNTYYGKTGNTLWAEFKARLTQEEQQQEDNYDMVRYNKLKDIPDNWDKNGNPRTMVEGFMNAGFLLGDGSAQDGNEDVIDVSNDMLRVWAIECRAGLYDAAFEAAGLDPNKFR